MTDLFDRLFSIEDDVEKIAVHAFTAAITDYIAGETTKAQIISTWSFKPEAQTGLTVLCNYIDGLNRKEDKVIFALELDAVMLLAECGLKYNTKLAFKTRLGL